MGIHHDHPRIVFSGRRRRRWPSSRSATVAERLEGKYPESLRGGPTETVRSARTLRASLALSVDGAGIKVTLRVATDYAAVIARPRAANFTNGYYGPASFAACPCDRRQDRRLVIRRQFSRRSRYIRCSTCWPRALTRSWTPQVRPSAVVPTRLRQTTLPRFKMATWARARQVLLSVWSSRSHANAVLALAQGTPTSAPIGGTPRNDFQPDAHAEQGHGQGTDGTPIKKKTSASA